MAFCVVVVVVGNPNVYSICSLLLPFIKSETYAKLTFFHSSFWTDLLPWTKRRICEKSFYLTNNYIFYFSYKNEKWRVLQRFQSRNDDIISAKLEKWSNHMKELLLVGSGSFIGGILRYLIYMIMHCGCCKTPRCVPLHHLLIWWKNVPFARLISLPTLAVPHRTKFVRIRIKKIAKRKRDLLVCRVAMNVIFFR